MGKWFDWQAEHLFHERTIAFPLSPALCGLAPETFKARVETLVERCAFLPPMTLSYGGMTFMTRERGSAGWMLFHRWRFTAAIAATDGVCLVEGRFRLRALDRTMGLFVANAWAAMLVLMVLIVLQAGLEMGSWDGLIILAMVPLLYLWLSFCMSMYVPQRRRGEADVRALLAVAT